jgi:hypothetical protein
LTGMLIGDSTRQFTQLAELLHEPLSSADLVRQAFARGLVGPGRQLFLRWAAWRSPASHRASANQIHGVTSGIRA